MSRLTRTDWSSDGKRLDVSHDDWPISSPTELSSIQSFLLNDLTQRWIVCDISPRNPLVDGLLLLKACVCERHQRAPSILYSGNADGLSHFHLDAQCTNHLKCDDWVPFYWRVSESRGSKQPDVISCTFSNSSYMSRIDKYCYFRDIQWNHNGVSL
jgi:hypothetical protein